MEGSRVNYFEFHIGDYSEATAHLSFVEDAALGRLIRKVYKTEAALPLELKEVQRLVGARTREEREAVQTVLQEFFEKREDGWHQTRCDAEIARFHSKQSKARSSANARWHGGDKKALPAHASEASSSMRSHVPEDATASAEHGKCNALQTPDSRLQEPHTLPAHDAVVCVDAQAVKAMREAGLQDAVVGNPSVIALLQKGVAVEQFAGAARIAAGVAKGVPYAIGVLRQQLREAEAIARLPDAATKAWDAGRTSIEAKGVELGLGKWDQAAWPAHGGESFAQYTDRVREALRRQEVAAT
nr:YdaU family protein [Ramlibacter lithotrophicus]